LDVLVLGPGNEDGFVPEWMELTALLWDTPVNFVIVDHNAAVIDSIKSNKIYYYPEKTLGSPEDRMKLLELVKEKSSVLDPSKPLERTMDFSIPKHNLTLKQADFTEFEYGIQAYDYIVALNSVFYLLNNPKFEPYHFTYFKTLINSLKIGCSLFFDKVTFDILRDWKDHDIDNIDVKNLGGFPNFVFKITRSK